MYGCFIGDNLLEEMEGKIYVRIKQLAEFGVRKFYSTGDGEFCKFCESVVKQFNGEIILIPFDLMKVTQYDMLWYDRIIPLSNITSVDDRNKRIVELSDLCISGICEKEETIQMLKYAKRKRKKFMVL